MPKPTDTNGLTFGMVVLKLLAAMKAEKQPPGNDAIANKIMMTLATSLNCIIGVVISPLRANGAHQVERIEAARRAGRDHARPVSAGDDQDGQAAGDDGCQRDAEQSAPLHVGSVAAVRSDVVPARQLAFLKDPECWGPKYG